MALSREHSEGCGQRALAAHLDTLTHADRQRLEDRLHETKLEAVARIFEASTAQSQHAAEPSPLSADDVVTLQARTEEQVQEWKDAGLRLLAQGRAGVLLLAGGQGTRLGSAAPKGCYDIGLPSHKSLFQLQAERLLRLQHLAACADGASAKPIMLYIMTSPMTHRETVTFFEQHRHFGLLASQVFCFQQGTLPCLTPAGEIILESDTELATAPDGNGGLYQALVQSGALTHMREHGIECLDCCSVDNALARAGDPLFLGCCSESGAPCGARVLQKADALEKVGVFVRCNGRLEVREYSEMGAEEASAADAATGLLRYPWSNICMHFFRVVWLAAVAEELRETARYHVARKQIPSKNGPVAGIKLEQFIFDPFPLAERVHLVEVAREEEFSPVKNAPGPLATDSPTTARQHLLALHTRWVEAAGGSVKIAGGVEVSPLLSYAGEGLSELCANKVYAKPGDLPPGVQGFASESDLAA